MYELIRIIGKFKAPSYTERRGLITHYVIVINKDRCEWEELLLLHVTASRIIHFEKSIGWFINLLCIGSLVKFIEDLLVIKFACALLVVYIEDGVDAVVMIWTSKSEWKPGEGIGKLLAIKITIIFLTLSKDVYNVYFIHCYVTLDLVKNLIDYFLSLLSSHWWNSNLLDLLWNLSTA